VATVATVATEYEELLISLREQESRVQFDGFDNVTAYRLGLQMAASATERSLPIAFAIRRGTQLLFQVAMPGTSAENDVWLDRKRRVTELSGRSSYLVKIQANSTGGTFEEYSRMDPGLYGADGGCFPVIVRGTGPVGTVTASGLTGAEDHAFVVGELATFLNA